MAAIAHGSRAGAVAAVDVVKAVRSPLTGMAVETSYTLTGLDAGIAYEVKLRATRSGLTCPPGSFATATGTTTAATTAGVTVSTAALTVVEGASGSSSR